MTANRRRLGMTSPRSSMRLPVISKDWDDRSVTFPPGRAKLETRPSPIGSLVIAKTIGISEVTCFAATAEVPALTITLVLYIGLEAHEFGGQLLGSLRLPLRPAILDFGRAP